MKLKDLNYDGIFVSTRYLTEKDYKILDKSFKDIYPIQYNKQFINLYLNSGNRLDCQYRDSYHKETSVKDLRKMFSNIKDKLK